MSQSKERWTIQFEGLADDPHGRPVAKRIALLLKHALRSLRLKCTDYSTTGRLKPKADETPGEV